MNARQRPRRRLRPEIRALISFAVILLLTQFLFALVAAKIVVSVCEAKAASESEQAIQAVHITEPTPAPVTVAAIQEPEAAPETVYFESVPLDADLQDHIVRTAQAEGIDPMLIFAMIDVESDYQADKLGDGGDSYGLMQIQPRWHSERMERLGCTDLLDPYQNVTVGVDFLSELIGYYDGDVNKAVIAYNMGQTGARKNCFALGVYSTKYSEAVFSERDALREV